LYSISVFLFAIGCNDNFGNGSLRKNGIILESPAFKENDIIPSKFTCDGKDISPPLSWSNLPNGSKSIVLIFDDPDAPVGTWVHWVIYNIPPDSNNLEENVPKDRELKNGAKQGRNDFGKIGYGGPCPPEGTHRYYFKLYAIDTILDLKTGTNKEKLENAMKGHIIAKAQLIGKYKR